MFNVGYAVDLVMKFEKDMCRESLLGQIIMILTFVKFQTEICICSNNIVCTKCKVCSATSDIFLWLGSCDK